MSRASFNRIQGGKFIELAVALGLRREKTADVKIDLFPTDSIPSVTITYHLDDEEVDRVIEILRSKSFSS